MKFALIASFIIAAFSAHVARAADEPQSTTTISAGVAVVPEYMGAMKHRTMPLLLIDYQNKNGFFASSLRGLGYQDQFEGIHWSAAIDYTGKREERSRTFFSGSDELKGMGDIPGGLVTKLGASYNVGKVTLGAEAELALNRRERGNSFGLNASVPLFADKNDSVSLTGAIKYGDRKYMQTYYGVTPDQSKSSVIYRAYTAKAGVSEVSVGANWTHVIDEKWSVRSNAGYTRLVGDAANSSIVPRRNSPFVISKVNYSF